MIRLISVVAVLLVALAVGAQAREGGIAGVIIETRTGKPVPYATVQIEGTTLGDIADSSGHFEIGHVPVGEFTLLVSSVGHEPRAYSVTVSDDSTAALRIELRPTRIEVGGIVVTGTRTPRLVRDAPVFTEVISRASIEDKTAHNIFEALEGESGVRVEQQCQGCNFSILRMQGLGADHTQVLLDGQPVYSGLASVYGLQQLSTADVERIEIVKGAGSALYGSNAVAGAINIISSIPRKTEGKIGIEIGEHGTNKYEVTASARKDKLGVFLFTQQSEQDELDETGDINAPGGINKPDGWIDRVRAKAKNAGFSLFLDDVFSADQMVVRGRVLSETRQGGWLKDNRFENAFAPGTEHIITDRYSVQLDYGLSLSGGRGLHSSLTFTSHERNATNDTFLNDYEQAKGELPPVDLLRPYMANERLLVAGVGLTQPLATRHRVLAGLQLTRNNLDESGVYLESDTEEAYVSTSNKEALELGAYLQDEFRMTDKLELVAGMRFDYHSSEDEFRGSGNVLPEGLEPLKYEESTINPRFSVKYSASDALTLRGSVGSGYRVPYGFSEDLHLCSGSPRVYKGGNLRPEKSFSYSLTADYARPTWNASLNLYRTELEDAIAFAQADEQIAELGYTYQWENMDDAFVTGAELNTSYSLTRDLALGVRFELFEGKYENPREDWIGTEFEDVSKRISRYPETSGGIKFNYSPSRWSFIVDVDYKGRMYIDLTEPANPADVKIHETESFAILNSKISRTLSERYTICIGARNLTDYTQEEKHIDDAAFLYAPVYGRIIYGGVQVSL